MMEIQRASQPSDPPRHVFRRDDTFDVDLVVEPRRPVTDPTLGITVKADPRQKKYSRRLVTLGDSLTQGFQHNAIHNTSLSWPAIVAGRLGLTAEGFRYPVFPHRGGYPLNIEELLRLDDDHIVKDAEHILAYLEGVKRFYAPATGPLLPPVGTPPNDNLAIAGWDIRDLLDRTVTTERNAIGHENLLERLLPTVDHSMNRNGVTTLTEYVDGSPQPLEGLTALELAERRASVGGTDGIETLVVWIGQNNVLGAIASLKIRPSMDDGYDRLDKKDAFTVWLPRHFESELRVLEERVLRISADHVVWGTVPHVTIPPLVHGVGGRLAANPRYFNYYARPWETDESFHPEDDVHLTGDEAWTIDSVIDAYDDAIVEMVRRQRAAGRDWRIVDTCAVLDRLAVRRNDEPGGKRYDYLPKYDLPPEYLRDGRFLDTRFIDVVVDDSGTPTLQAGGLIGLDGVHPTTAGYAMVAHEFMKVMNGAGVRFPGVAAGTDPAPHWADIVRRDTILSDPPRHVDDVMTLIRTLEETWHAITHAAWA